MIATLFKLSSMINSWINSSVSIVSIVNVYLYVWIIDLWDMCYDFWKCLAPGGERFLPNGLQRNFVYDIIL